MSSVPGLTASHDSEWFASNGPALHVPAWGTLEPAGTGYPPPVAGELATTFVKETLAFHPEPPGESATAETASTSTAAPSAKSAVRKCLMHPPFACRELALRGEPTPATPSAA